MSNLCKKCRIRIIDNTDHCPFCGSVFESPEPEEMTVEKIFEQGSGGFPDAAVRAKKLRFACAVVLFVSIIAAAACVIINIFTGNSLWWSFIVLAGLAIVNVILQYGLSDDSGYRAKFLVMTALGVFFVIAVDAVLGFYGWSVNIVLPGAIILLNIAIIVMIIVNRRNWQSYITSEILTVILSLIVLALIIPGIITFPLIAVIAAAFSILLFLGTIIIGGQRAETELKRRFHI